MGCDIFRQVLPTLSRCFCCSSKLGTRIIGLMQLVSGLFFLNRPFSFFPTTKLCVMTGIWASRCVTEMLLSIFLLEGVNQDRLELIRIWLYAGTASAFFWMIFEFSLLFQPEQDFISMFGMYNMWTEHFSFWCIRTVVTPCFILVVVNYYSSKLRQSADSEAVPYIRLAKV